MLGLPLRYWLKHPAIGVADLASDPQEIWTTIQDSYIAARERRGREIRYEPDETWERRLHDLLGVPWPCEVSSEFWELWPKVIRSLEAKGIQPGPKSFLSWNDGDAAFVRAIWCLVRHLKPKTVVETGVAHGVTSRCILEAMERNGNGHLWSIDLPPIERYWRNQIGVAVEGRYAEEWSYVRGSSRRRLPELLSRLGQIDQFIHDSLHSERNVRFELDLAWEVLKPDGAIVVDDIDASWGFKSFTHAFPGHPSLVCEAEPLHPDLRRFNKKGLFGVILKRLNAQV
jgi:hypothetical protein